MIFAVQVFDLTLRTENYVTTPGLVVLIRAFVLFCVATYFPDHCMLSKFETICFLISNFGLHWVDKVTHFRSFYALFYCLEEGASIVRKQRLHLPKRSQIYIVNLY